MIIHAVFYDEFGKKIGSSVEDDADHLPPRAPTPQTGNLLKGTQRRPSEAGREVPMSYDRQWQHLYNKAAWRGPCGVKLAKLRLTPLCEVIGCTRPATCVDHRKAHHGNWDLFIGGNNMENLRSLCKPHHDAKEGRYETGKEEHNPVSVTGEQGRQFLSASVTPAQMKRALAFDVDELLSGIPD